MGLLRATVGFLGPLSLCVAAVLGSCASFGEAASPDGGVGGADGSSDDAGDAGDARETAAYAAAVLADKPLAYWRLGEAKGAIARSIAGGDTADGLIHGGMLGAPGALLGDPDTALAISAAGHLVEVTNNFDFHGAAAFSLEAWMNLSVIDDQFRHLFIKDTNVGAREEYGVFVTIGDGLVIERHVGGTKLTAKWPGGAAMIPLATWHHVVATYDGTKLTLFLDGERGISTPDDRLANPNAAPFFFGGKNRAGGALLGTIDEVAVYDKALPDERVGVHFKLGTLGKLP